ncbi:MAG: S8/S53 family peptidase [Anaerolineales bacterium]
MTVLPTYDPNSDQGWQMDLRSFDLSSLDFRNSLDDLLYATFDDRTIWPAAEMMPGGFDWQGMMDLGKNPGLDLRSLHGEGITGTGIGIAIIDQPLLVDHQEYTNRLRLYEEINVEPDTGSQMHGPAVASIAVGKTTGVAPGADLYYIGSWTGDWGTGGEDNFTYNFVYYAQAIRRILHINAQLPEGRKIRVIAMQTGWRPNQAGYDEITAAVAEAAATGLLVVSSTSAETAGSNFIGMGRAPLADPDAFVSYEPGLFWAKSYFQSQWLHDTMLVPMDSRTTASPTGVEDYVFYREGGLSWAIPYIAGVYALAAQVKPDITPKVFWSTALDTGRTIELSHEGRKYSFGVILDPVALIGALQAK